VSYKKKTATQYSKRTVSPRTIYYPSWTPPEHFVAELKEEMKQNPNRKTASDTEAMVYLSTASMANPMSEEWSRIYFHLFYNYLKRKKIPINADMRFLSENKTLRNSDRRELERLKKWIFEQQQKDLKERIKKRRN
jgi:hypothetical protein